MFNQGNNGDESFGFAPNSDNENPELDSSGGLFPLGQVPLTISGDILADIYSTQEKPSTSALELDLHKLYALIGYDERGDGERYYDEAVSVKPIADDFQPDNNTRGPYYGKEMLFSKLADMKSAWNYIEAIYYDNSDVLTVFYIKFPDNDKDRKRSGLKKPKTPRN